MDLSKLPKLSKTPAPPPGEEPSTSEATPPVARPALDYEPYQSQLPGIAEAWISIAIGLILLFVFPHTFQYLHSPFAFEQNNPVTDAQGNPLAYVKSGFFWTDLGVTIFALALLLEGVTLVFSRKLGLVWATFLITALASLFNLGVVIVTYSMTGFALVCALAVAIGGYMAMTQLRLIQILQNRAKAKK